MNSLVSIIVPVFNPKENYLVQCIESLVNQTYHNIEIILVDDGSAEKTAAICDHYRDQFSVVNVIHKDNEGVSVARNIGIAQSHGDYIMFVDADDWLELDCIETILPKIIKSESDFLYFHHNVVLGNEVHPKKGTELVSGYIHQDRIHELQLNMITENRSQYPFSPLTPWGKIIRREACLYPDTVFPVGLKRSQDVIFNLYVLEHIKSAYSFPYIGYNYRVHNDSSVNRLRPDISFIVIRFLKEAEKFIDIYHQKDPEYLQKLGYRAIKQLSFIEKSYTLHPESKLNWKQILSYSKAYLNEPVVKKYIKFSSLKDCITLKDVIYFFIVKYKIFILYYIYCMILKKPHLQFRYKQQSVS